MTHTAFIWGLIPYPSSIQRQIYTVHIVILFLVSCLLFIESYTDNKTIQICIISPISIFINGQLLELKKLLTSIKKLMIFLEERLTRYI